jgi:hypothetical protein
VNASEKILNKKGDRGSPCLIPLEDLKNPTGLPFINIENQAFDRVSWPFINSVLLKFGFHGKFVHCIMKNLSQAWFSILINGKPVGFFKSSRGVRSWKV